MQVEIEPAIECVDGCVTKPNTHEDKNATTSPQGDQSTDCERKRKV